MNALFKVTESFVDGERHIESLRSIGLDDFDFFEEVPYESKGTDQPYRLSGVGTYIRAGVTVTGTLKPEVLAEIVRVFPVDDPHFRFDRFSSQDDCKYLASGQFRQDGHVEEDYRGCKTIESRKAKEDRVLPKMRQQVTEMIPAIKQDIVNIVNDMLGRIAIRINGSYEQSAIQNLTSEWEGLLEQAGLAAEQAEAERMFREAKAKLGDVRKRLNAWVLADMEKDGWKVNGKTLASPVVEKLRKHYSEAVAFKRNDRILIS
jgi:hypothetical protein